MTDIKEWIQQSPETNREKLCKRFKDDNEFAYKFGKKHPKYQDFAKHFINTSQYAYFWAHDIGNRGFMKQIVEKSGDEIFIGFWNNKFEDDQI